MGIISAKEVADRHKEEMPQQIPLAVPHLQPQKRKRVKRNHHLPLLQEECLAETILIRMNHLPIRMNECVKDYRFRHPMSTQTKYFHCYLEIEIGYGCND